MELIHKVKNLFKSNDKETRFIIFFKHDKDFTDFIDNIINRDFNTPDSYHKDVYCDNYRLRHGKYSQDNLTDKYYIINDTENGLVTKNKEEITHSEYIKQIKECKEPVLVKEDYFYEFSASVEFNGSVIDLDNLMIEKCIFSKDIKNKHNAKHIYSTEAEDAQTAIFWQNILKQLNIDYTETTMSLKDILLTMM